MEYVFYVSSFIIISISITLFLNIKEVPKEREIIVIEKLIKYEYISALMIVMPLLQSISLYLLGYEVEKNNLNGYIMLIEVFIPIANIIYIAFKDDQIRNEAFNKFETKLSFLIKNKKEMINKNKPYFKISNGEIIYKEIIETYIKYLSNYIDILNMIKEYKLDVDMNLKKYLEETSYQNFIEIEESVQKMSSSELFKKNLINLSDEMEYLKTITIEFVNLQMEQEEREKFGNKLRMYM